MLFVAYEDNGEIICFGEGSQSKLDFYKNVLIIDEIPENIRGLKVIDGCVQPDPDYSEPEKDWLENRLLNYPYQSDQIDAIFKGFEAIKDQLTLPQDTLDWINQVRAVKEQFPK